MARRRESDSSLLIGLILGSAVGAAIVTILSARPEDAPTLSAISTSGHSSNASSDTSVSGATSITAPRPAGTPATGSGTTMQASDSKVAAASKALEENDSARVEGASEGSAD